MPWQETCAMEERQRLIRELQREAIPVTTVCACYGISRQTAYKLLRRYEREGLSGLQDQSRRPHTMPRTIAPPLQEALLAMRRAHPDWGPRLVVRVLARRQPTQAWPAISTVGELFRRHGLVRRRRQRSRTPGALGGLRRPTGPNAVWGVDFKGHFRLGTGARCHPLTISDLHSRYLLRCQGLVAERTELAWPVFEAAFREYGLPQCIRTDNGAPFASRAPGGLSRLSVWWLKLGIWPERITPGCPQQNGCHERMHRTLKAATARPPRRSFPAQQRAFGQFQREFNHERPHQALGDLSPAHCYSDSPRRYPSRLAEPAYPAHFEVRRVRHSGEIKWRGHLVGITDVLTGEPVGLEEVRDGAWLVYFATLPLGVLDDATHKLHLFPPARRR
jgi:putative transposase